MPERNTNRGACVKRKRLSSPGCSCCDTNEALWFLDDENSAFVDEHGAAKVTVKRQDSKLFRSNTARTAGEDCIKDVISRTTSGKEENV